MNDWKVDQILIVTFGVIFMATLDMASTIAFLLWVTEACQLGAG